MATLLAGKELANPTQPLCLYTITCSDGTVARYSTHAVTYSSNAYAARISNGEVAMKQALGEQGIDIPTNVMLRLADPDYYIWSNIEDGHGLKGAVLEMRVVLYDVIAGTFSSTSRVIFKGICKEPGGQLPKHDGKILSVGFASKMNLADISLPTIKIQKTCPWIFPSTLAERQEGADDSTSRFYPCGYSPDATGGNARGTYQTGTTAFTTCAYSKSDCQARGMYTVDNASPTPRVTGRFGGVQWMPPENMKVRAFGKDSPWEIVSGNPNEMKYGDYVPLLYGMAWTDPAILNTVPDGNMLRMEALICFGQVATIHEVMVNDVHIPHLISDGEILSTGPGVSSQTVADQGGWWTTVNKGDRSGAPSADAGYSGYGDPYGSLCVIEIVIPRKIGDWNSIPRVRVYAEKGSSEEELTSPATQIQLLLSQWASWQTAEINTTSFTAATAVDRTIITKTDINGNASATDYRFRSSVYIRNRTSMATIIRGMRNARRGILDLDDDGLIAMRTASTLAVQQPSTVSVSGSNYLTAVSSKNAAGTTTNGYVAYRFDESNILEVPKVSVLTAGNRYSLQFQNSENLHSWDTFQPIDSQDIARSDQEIPGNFEVLGPDGYDQLRRLISTYTAEKFRGNSRGDTGGTNTYEFPISVKGVHLNISDICMMNWEPLGLANQLVRVIRIAPGENAERFTLTVAWHNDNWYVDTYGQVAQPGFTSSHRNRLLRPAFPWQPKGAQPITGNSLYSTSEWNFSLSPDYELGGDVAIAKLNIGGKQIVNQAAPVAPPFVPLQGIPASTGGSILGGTRVCMAIASVDSSGGVSFLSRITTSSIAAGTNTNTATVPTISWNSSTVGYKLYAGYHPSKMSFQRSDSSTPSSLTLTSISESLDGPPDGEFDHYRVRVKPVWHSGLWAAQVVAVTSTTIKLAVPSSFTTNEYRDYDITWLAALDSESVLPIADFRIESNNGDTLTLTAGNPSTAGIVAGDLMVMRSKPTYGTDGTGQYIEDAGWTSVFFGSGMTVDEEIDRIVRVIAGTGRGQTARVKSNTSTKLYCDFVTPLDATSRYIVEAKDWDVIQDGSSVTNSTYNATMSLSVNVSNYIGKTLLVQVLTVDGGDTESIEALSPIREIYLQGRGIVWITKTADYVCDGTEDAIAVDTTGGDVDITLAPILAGRKRGRLITVKKTSADVNVVNILPPAGTTIDGASSLVLSDEGASRTFVGDEG